MEIKFICTHWGQNDVLIEEFIKKAIGEGFDGIESNISSEEKATDSFFNVLEKQNASFIAQQYLPPAIETVDQYKEKIKDTLFNLTTYNPLFINSHTGKDFYSFEENSSIIEVCNSISEQTGVKVLHETHRGRFAYHAGNIIPYIKKYGNLKFNADFSHFCVVSESLLEDQEHILKQIIPHCDYIHARVGYSQGAQVNHPFAPEWKDTMDRFMGWWQAIINNAKENGQDTFYVCPEFGPEPYLQTLPFTQKPVSDQLEINIQMMHFLRDNLR